MVRMACINLPAFPLQLLIQRHPDWKNEPAAVVDKDKPQGIIQWVNKRALHFRILPGMRYAKGLSLSPDLRAGEVPEADIARHIGHLIELFRFYTPDVEPSTDEPGVFWLDAAGMTPLHESLGKWAGLIGDDLTKIGFHWSIAVGFSRYGSYAIAKSSRGITVFDSDIKERARARSVALVRLGIDPALRDALSQLNITTLGGFMDLPENGIRKRFGAEAHDFYKLAHGELYKPLEARPPVESFTVDIALDYPETSTQRLLAYVEPELESIFTSLERRGRLLSAVKLTLRLDNGEQHREHLSTAAPTLDRRQVLDLLDLRLHKLKLASGVVEIALEADSATISHKQLELFRQKTCRETSSADRAFARLRAEFGDEAVVRARLRDGHLPEASYDWEPMKKQTTPAPRRIKARSLVRRIYPRSMEFLSWTRLSARRTGEADGRPAGSAAGPGADHHRPAHPLRQNLDVIGPYIISGGWWMRRIERDYYYVRSQSGRWLWVYYDRRRRRAFVQGTVE